MERTTAGRVVADMCNDRRHRSAEANWHLSFFNRGASLGSPSFGMKEVRSWARDLANHDS